MEERLQKILARAGLGSRRACEALITEGRVTVNGRLAELGQKADPARDKIAVDGEPLTAAETLTYVALNKPRGVIASLEAQGKRQTVRDLVPLAERLYPVGRLDLDSEGLMLLTNDGELTDRLTHPRYETEKEYQVLVRGEPDEKQLEAWRRGVVVEGKRTAPAQVKRENRTEAGTWLRVIMHEGRKHEIRDIGRLLGMPVKRIVRVRIGTLRLGALRPGEWRELGAREVEQLRGQAGPKSRPARSVTPGAGKARSETFSRGARRERGDGDSKSRRTPRTRR
ncbi:MAG: pseudouridine synthase [Anaerolineales bacterium]